MEQKKENRVSLFHLFITFFRLGITAFGGPASILYIKKVIVEQQKWLEEKIFVDGIALCQTIPGATAMQMSAYAGLKIRDIRGAITSYVAFALPSFLIMLFLSVIYMKTQQINFVHSIFNGLQIIIVAIVANATFVFAKQNANHFKDFVVILTAAILFFFKVNPVLVIIVSGILAVGIYKKSLPQHEPAITTGKSNNLKPLAYMVAFVIICLVLLYFINQNLFRISLLMLKIDFFAYGGGFSALPIMYHEVVDIKGWLDHNTFLNGIVLGQITPGPIVITATFIGYIFAGLLGSIIATLSIFAPSFLMVIGIAPYFDKLQTYSFFRKLVKGVFCSFIGLLLIVTYRFGGEITWNPISIILCIFAFIALMKKIQIYWVVLVGLILSIFLF
jgi:chromate transporter